jgi:hypothetical protein
MARVTYKLRAGGVLSERSIYRHGGYDGWPATGVQRFAQARLAVEIHPADRQGA